MQTVRLHSDRMKNIIDFLKLFRPEKTNQGKKINLDGFVNAIGHNYSENNLLNGIFGEQDHLDSFYSFNDLINAVNQNKHLIGLGADVWFSPGLLLNKRHIKASTSYISWLTSLYVDIDGIEGVKDADKALDKLYSACDREGIKRPNIVLHTSTNPTVHLQAFWLIDPIYIKNDDKELNNSRISWWEQSQIALCEALEDSDSDFNIDTSVNDPSKYMRLPYTINQKTGEMVYILDKNITDRRNLLSDYWLNKLRKHYVFNKKRNKAFINNIDNKNLLEHPQFKVLSQGVDKGIRFFSLYAVAKACLGSGLTLEQAKDKLLEMNNLSKPPEKEKKVLYIAERAYEDGKGISISIVAELANTTLGKDKFEPDPTILKLFNLAKGTYKTSSKENKKTVLDKIVNSIKKLKEYGHKELLSQKQLSKLFNINYNTLKNYFNKAKSILREQGIYLVYIVKKQNYVFMNFSEWVNYVLSKVKNNNVNNNFVLKSINKSFPQPLYIFSLYSIKRSLTFLQRARGSP